MNRLKQGQAIFLIVAKFLPCSLIYGLAGFLVWPKIHRYHQYDKPNRNPLSEEMSQRLSFSITTIVRLAVAPNGVRMRGARKVTARLYRIFKPNARAVHPHIIVSLAHGSAAGKGYVSVG